MAVTLFRSVGSIGAAVQAAKGTPVTTPTVFFKIQGKPKFTVVNDTAFYRDGNQKYRTVAIKKGEHAEMEFTCLMHIIDVGTLFAWSFGPSSDTISGGSDPYTHTEVLKDRQLWTTWKIGYFADASATSMLVETWSDCKVQKIKVAGKAGDLILMTVTLIGTVGDTSQSLTSVVYSDAAADGPFVFHQATFTLTAWTSASVIAGQLQDFEFTIDWGIEPVSGPNSVALIEAFEGGFTLPVKFTAKVDAAVVRKFIDYGGNSGTAISATIGTGSLVITIQTQSSPLHNIAITFGALNFVGDQLEMDPAAQSAEIMVMGEALKSGATMPISAVVKSSVSSSWAA